MRWKNEHIMNGSHGEPRTRRGRCGSQRPLPSARAAALRTAVVDLLFRGGLRSSVSCGGGVGEQAVFRLGD